jgi:xylose isomerase
MDTFGYRFSFGPWNIHEGSDPFGPPVRPARDFLNKLSVYQDLSITGVQLHDDDAVPELNTLSPAQILQHTQTLRHQLDDRGLVAEFVAPRLWEHPLTIDGAFTANDPQARAYALDRAKKAVDIAGALGTDLIVLWLAREGTYLREAKDPVRATEQLVQAIDTLLAYHPQIRIAIEPKPNEPVDLAYIPTMGHALALAHLTQDPSRVGVLMESAHAILAGLDPSDEIGFALAFGKLWSVHLNDQNGLKYDQDRSFGSVDLRRAFNQVRVLDQHDYAQIGMVGLDVKALRTQSAEVATKHLRNSMSLFLRLVSVVRALDVATLSELVAARDYEEIDALILQALMG